MRMVVLAMIELAFSVVLARYFADTAKDAWLMVCIGAVGCMLILAMGYLDWCVSKSDNDETAD